MRVASGQTSQEKDASVFFSKITLSNNNFIFGLSAEFTLSIKKESGEPTYQTTEDANIYVNLFKVEGTQAIQDLSQASDYESFVRIANNNKNSVEHISVPYYNNGVAKQGSVDFTQEINFSSPLSQKSSPENLSLFAVVAITDLNNQRSFAISEISRQEIILNNDVILLKNINDIRSVNLDSYLNFDIINQVKDNNEAYFSDQFISYDKDGYIKFAFMWDKIQFLQEKSLFGNILKNGSVKEAREKMIQDSRISNLQILRRRVKKNIDGFSNFDKNQKNEVVISSSDDDFGDLLYNERTNVKTGRLEAEISQVNAVMNSGDYVTFAVNDYAPQKIKHGLYQYYINVELEDGMLKYLLDSLEELRNASKTFMQYQSFFFSPPPELRDATLSGVDKMLEILFSMASFTEPRKGKIEAEIKSLINFIDGFETLMTFNDSLMNKIMYALSQRGVSNSKGKDSSYRKNVSKLFFLEDKQKFAEIVDFSDLIGQKTEYIGTDSVKNFGMATFSDTSIKERFLQEFKKNVNFEGAYEDINFSDLNEKMLEDNSSSPQDAEVSSELFNLKTNFFSYLSPARVSLGGKSVKNNNYNPKTYVPSDNASLNTFAEDLLSKGVRIMTPLEVNQKKQKELEKDLCSERVFGSDVNINTQRTYEGQSNISSVSGAKRFYETIQNSQSFINGVNKHYNNFNLQKKDYNLNSPDNLLKRKSNKENEVLFNSEIGDIPNQIKVLFGSNSDLVRNKWNLTENDFFANPDSIKMMQENYSNLIRVEVLDNFMTDAAGMKNVKSPMFRKLKIDDIQGLTSGKVLLCKTYVYNDASLGIGQRNISDNESIYYNKYFLIKKEESE
jgi:hypothetical protein